MISQKEYIESRVIPEPMSGCWLWLGGISDRGYGIANYNKKRFKAHRFVYQTLVGEIKEGLCLDHLCRVRSCVNPKHLEQVTFQENVSRGLNFTAINAAKTHCIRGHEYNLENTYILRGGRYCRKCSAFREGQCRQRRKQNEQR